VPVLRPLVRAVFPALTVLLLSGCGGRQNVLRPESHPEREIATLWWVMLAGASIGFAVIGGLLLLGWARRGRTGLPFGGGERAGTVLVVALGVAVPIVVLTLLFVWSDVVVLRSTAAPSPASTSLTVRVVGHQWFWEIRYPGGKAVTANELHIPTRTRVNLVGTTADVIHSFWVPELNRKIDLIPGRTNRMLLEADEPGVYRGQCAEFCGLQHAHMALYVFAEPRPRFSAWLAREARPARPPRGGEERKGRSVFLDESCADCHTIRGTPASGKVGPDLTHVGSRTTLAALTIPNERDALEEWIRDPQHVKPGNLMPDTHVDDGEVRALAAYLESLH
jgi:cytochrome c oxidase subunit II